MTPIDFVIFDGDSSPNTPAYKVAEAMTKPIKIFVAECEFIVLGYYMNQGAMVLDIESKKKSL